VPGPGELAQNRSGCRSGNIGHDCQLLLADIDLDWRAVGRRSRPAVSQVKQHGDEALLVIAAHQVVDHRHGDFEVGEADQRKVPPCRIILRDDGVYGMERQIKQLGAAGGAQPNHPGLASEGGRPPDPRAGPQEVSHERPTLQGRDVDGKASADETKETAGRVTPAIDRTA